MRRLIRDGLKSDRSNLGPYDTLTLIELAKRVENNAHPCLRRRGEARREGHHVERPRAAIKGPDPDATRKGKA